VNEQRFAQWSQQCKILLVVRYCRRSVSSSFVLKRQLPIVNRLFVITLASIGCTNAKCAHTTETGILQLPSFIIVPFRPFVRQNKASDKMNSTAAAAALHFAIPLSGCHLLLHLNGAIYGSFRTLSIPVQWWAI